MEGGELCQLVGLTYFCLEKNKLLTEVQSQRGGNEETRVFLWLAGHPLFDRLFTTAGACDSFRPFSTVGYLLSASSSEVLHQAIWNWGTVPGFLARNGSFHCLDMGSFLPSPLVLVTSPRPDLNCQEIIFQRDNLWNAVLLAIIRLKCAVYLD